MYKRNAGEVLIMNELSINKYWCKFESEVQLNPHYAYTHRCMSFDQST